MSLENNVSEKEYSAIKSYCNWYSWFILALACLAISVLTFFPGLSDTSHLFRYVCYVIIGGPLGRCCYRAYFAFKERRTSSGLALIAPLAMFTLFALVRAFGR